MAWRGPFKSPGRDLVFPQPTPVHEQRFEPVPVTHTPPWDETYPIDAPDPALYSLIVPVVPEDDGTYIHEHMNLPVNWREESRVLEDEYWNDDQLDGTAVPPGAPNDQPFQSGHTQITVLNQSAEQGYGQDPALRWARYPHYSNSFPGYAAGTHRRNGGYPAEKNFLQMYEIISEGQIRDMSARHTKQHRVFGAIVADAPTVPHTYNVTPIDPLPFYSEPIGSAGVTPDW